MNKKDEIYKSEDEHIFSFEFEFDKYKVKVFEQAKATVENQFIYIWGMHSLNKLWKEGKIDKKKYDKCAVLIKKEAVKTFNSESE